MLIRLLWTTEIFIFFIVLEYDQYRYQKSKIKSSNFTICLHKQSVSSRYPSLNEMDQARTGLIA